MFFLFKEKLTKFFLERDLWKQKYLLEKKKTLALEERARTSAVKIHFFVFIFKCKISLENIFQLDRTDVKSQLEQAKIELKNSIKVKMKKSIRQREFSFSFSFSFDNKPKRNVDFYDTKFNKSAAASMFIQDKILMELQFHQNDKIFRFLLT